MADHYVVVVEGNIVRAIERHRSAPPRPIPATPLEVSSELAANHRANGCIDGRYYFDDPQRARTFASLCLEFTRARVEKLLAAIERLPAGVAEYRADEETGGGRDPDPAAA
jgi:hypothetical protein